jgi:sulfonate transport system ATP-binding protein
MAKDLAVHIDEKWIGSGIGRTKILGRCHFDVEPGELLVLLGESGCGKSTLLRMILALDKDYSGTIESSNQKVNESVPNRGIVFQEPRLLPWMTAVQNIEFAMSGEDAGEARTDRAQKMLSLVGLNGFENNLPRQLSGGMAQRTALARALVNLPDILLLDEPFAALDLHTRFRLQDELTRVIGQTSTTTILVTHDIDEALYLADRIIVLSGRPGSVKAIHRIANPRPRQRAAHDLLEMRAKLFDELITESVSEPN